MSDAAAPMASPVWTEVAEDIACPLCDYNLRGLREPRCPECGFRFQWPDLLDPARRKHPFLFEHHPEQNIRSFAKTLVASVRPKRFWTTLHPAQPSRPRRLLFYWAVPAIPFLLSALLLMASMAFSALRQNRANLAWETAYYNSPARAAQKARLVRLYGSFQAYLNQYYGGASFWAELRDVAKQGELIRLFAAVGVITFGWPWLTLLALLVFRMSMRRVRVRTDHVIRCVIYSAGPAMWGMSCVIAASGLVRFGLIAAGQQSSMIVVVAICILGVSAAFCHACVSLRRAYRDYLKFDWPGATVVASQVIVMLLVMNVIFLPAIFH